MRVYQIMRFILITFGSYGDIYPFVWIGRLLNQQGHEVIFLTNPYFEEVLSKEAFKFEPIGTVEEYKITINSSSEVYNIKSKLKKLKATLKLIKQLIDTFYMKNINEIFEKVAHLRTDNTIIITHFILMGSKIVAEKFSIPNINVNLSTQWIRSFRKSVDFTSFIDARITKLSNILSTGTIFHSNKFLIC